MTLAPPEDLTRLRIAVTGHRVLLQTDRIAAGIENALARIEGEYPGRSLMVVSSLAEGADRLVAAAVLKRPHSCLQAVLPLPKFDYLGDFATPASKEDFLRFLARTDDVVELPAQPSRDDAYAAANDRLLDGVDVLIAVWDGKGAQGHGGTAEVVGRARASHLPVAWVHAGNRKPGTMEPTSLGADQGKVTYENL